MLASESILTISTLLAKCFKFHRSQKKIPKSLENKKKILLKELETFEAAYICGYNTLNRY